MRNDFGLPTSARPGRGPESRAGTRFARLVAVLAGALLAVQATGCTGLVPGLPI